MLKEILSISGKPGLYKMVSQGKNMLIIESLTDGKRQPAYTRDKAVSLGDIAMFTETDEVPLAEVLESIKKKEGGNKATIDPKSDNDALRDYLEEVLPDFDRDRVYPSDIRKLISWYNLLIDKGITEFVSEEESDDKAPESVAKPKQDSKSAPGKNEPKVQNKQPKIAQKTAVNRKMGG